MTMDAPGRDSVIQENVGSQQSGGPADGLCLLLRQGGDAAGCCVSGWSKPEAAETWCLGPRSVLRLPAPRIASPHMLTLHLRPHVQPGRLAAQRLRVLANGVAVGSFTLRGAGPRTCVIPPEAWAGRAALEIMLETPDAARPVDFGIGADDRCLAFALSRLRLEPDRFAGVARAGGNADPTLAELMLRFESLGENCEFGLAQRSCDAEPLGLLRFASTPLANLMAALDGDFAGMDRPEAITVELSPNGREYMIHERAFGVRYHAWVRAGEMTPEDLHRREARRLPLLLRKLREELRLGEKIFVFKGMGAMAEELVFPLVALLRRYGPNTLLFVSLADAGHAAGAVERRGSGFLVGALDRFAPGENAHDFLREQWIAVCRAALRLADGAL